MGQNISSQLSLSLVCVFRDSQPDLRPAAGRFSYIAMSWMRILHTWAGNQFKNKITTKAAVPIPMLRND